MLYARIAVLLTRSNELSLVEAFWIRIENIYNNKNPHSDCPSFFDFGFRYTQGLRIPLLPLCWYITTCMKYFIAFQNWYIQFFPDASACEYDIHPFNSLIPFLFFSCFYPLVIPKMHASTKYWCHCRTLRIFNWNWGVNMSSQYNRA